ncbi:hypothetical protein ACIA6T_12220 [Streptomyces sp. NPDC051740]|uniref:hypothetical protein n=1 Tax=Streptomyces sp. NPDC051740 TaxID=3365673 RepID=UPI0037A0EFD3
MSRWSSVMPGRGRRSGSGRGRGGTAGPAGGANGTGNRGAGGPPVEDVDGVLLVRSVEDDSFPLDVVAEVAGAVGREEDVVTVIVGSAAGGGAPDADHWARLGALLDSLRARGTDRVRLVMSGAGDDRPDRPSVARRIADAWELEVTAPDGAVLITPGGTLFVHGDSRPGRAWWRFAPGAEPRKVGRRAPAPAWEEALDGVPARTAGGCVVDRVPAGVVIRPAEAPGPAPDDLCFSVPVDFERLTVLVGAPQAEDVGADEVAAVLAGLPEAERARARLAPGGRRDLLRLGQSVADLLGTEVEVLTGLPLLDDHAPPGTPPRPTLVGLDGRPSWRPFVSSVVCGPVDAEGRAPVPRPVEIHPPDWILGGGERGTVRLTDHWQATVTRAGLALWAPDGPRPGPLGPAVDPEACAIELGMPGQPLDDSLLPALSRLVRGLGTDVRARTTLLVRGRLLAGDGALRRLAAEHGIPGIRYVTAARPAWSGTAAGRPGTVAGPGRVPPPGRGAHGPGPAAALPAAGPGTGVVGPSAARPGQVLPTVSHGPGAAPAPPAAGTGRGPGRAVPPGAPGQGADRAVAGPRVGEIGGAAAPGGAAVPGGAVRGSGATPAVPGALPAIGVGRGPGRAVPPGAPGREPGTGAGGPSATGSGEASSAGASGRGPGRAVAGPRAGEAGAAVSGPPAAGTGAGVARPDGVAATDPQAAEPGVPVPPPAPSPDGPRGGGAEEVNGPSAAGAGASPDVHVDAEAPGRLVAGAGGAAGAPGALREGEHVPSSDSPPVGGVAGAGGEAGTPPGVLRGGGSTPSPGSPPVAGAGGEAGTPPGTSSEDAGPEEAEPGVSVPAASSDPRPKERPAASPETGAGVGGERRASGPGAAPDGGAGPGAAGPLSASSAGARPGADGVVGGAGHAGGERGGPGPAGGRAVRAEAPAGPPRRAGEASAPRRAALPFVPGHVSGPAERAAFRDAAAGAWEGHAAAVSRVLTRMPALRGHELETARTDLIAAHAYLTAEEGPLHHRELIRDLHTGEGRLLPYAGCLASALRRLPSYRGVALRGGDADGPEPAVGTLLHDPAPVSALAGASALPAGAPVRYAVWSVTGRKVRQLIDRPGGPPEAYEEIVFVPGTGFRVLGVRAVPAGPSVVLLRELPGNATAYMDGSEELSGLDLKALTHLEEALAKGFRHGDDPQWPDRCSGPVGQDG